MRDAGHQKPRKDDDNPSPDEGRDRAARSKRERGINEARIAAGAARRAARISACNGPPPLSGLSVGELAERVVRAGAVDRGRPAVHEEGDADRFRRFLFRSSGPGRSLSV